MMSIARHEAGHAVVADVQGLTVIDRRVDLAAQNGCTRFPEFDPNGAERGDLEKYAVVALAGWEAQIHREPDLNRALYEDSIQRDIDQACSLIRCIPVSDEDRQAIYDQCNARARALVKENDAKIDTLAAALLQAASDDGGHLSGAAIEKLIAG
jgi:ATP-dependent Zn protease